MTQQEKDLIRKLVKRHSGKKGEIWARSEDISDCECEYLSFTKYSKRYTQYVAAVAVHTELVDINRITSEIEKNNFFYPDTFVLETGKNILVVIYKQKLSSLFGYRKKEIVYSDLIKESFSLLHKTISDSRIVSS